jgi:hypothetical protein
MNCVYLVVKHTYGDFDIPISQTVAASMDENKCKDYAAALAAKVKIVHGKAEATYKVTKMRLL